MTAFQSLFRSPKTLMLAIFCFLLPWQTQWIFGQTYLQGDENPYNVADTIHFATPFGVMGVHLTEMVLLVGAVLVMLCARPRIQRAYRTPTLLAVAVFTIAALSLLITRDTSLSLTALLHLGTAMLFFMLLLDRDVALKPVLVAFGAGLIAPSLLGFWQIIFDSSPASTIFGLAARDADTLGDAVTIAKDGSRQLRAYGSFPHPNVFGGYLAVGMLALVSATRGVDERVKRFLLGAALLLTVALVFTASRSAILGLALGIGLAGLVQRMRNTKVARIAVIPIAIMVIAGALLGSIFAPNLAASIRGGGVTEDNAIAERVEQYHDYFRTLDGNLFFGNGLGAYVTKAYLEGACTSWECQPIHNVPLLIVGEIGIIGALIVLAWSSTIDRINFARFPRLDATMAFAMGNVVLVILFFDHYIWSSWPGLALIAFVMALTVRMGEKA